MKLTTELKTALWQIANLAMECKDDKLNGVEFEQKGFDILKKIVEDANKDAYNQAIEDSAKSVSIFKYTLDLDEDEIKMIPENSIDLENGWIASIDRQSILKLKK